MLNYIGPIQLALNMNVYENYVVYEITRLIESHLWINKYKFISSETTFQIEQ